MRQSVPSTIIRPPDTVLPVPGPPPDWKYTSTRRNDDPHAGELFQIRLSVFGGIVGEKPIGPPGLLNSVQKRFRKGKQLVAKINRTIHVQQKQRIPCRRSAISISVNGRVIPFFVKSFNITSIKIHVIPRRVAHHAEQQKQDQESHPKRRFPMEADGMPSF